ncbi:aminoglycoside phosphotransferase family protein [Microlunatus sp. Y2014]|uniref:aminoglycoside phosphotransferase family protein n=1 Tax=Microlunatus sp. Y2014 TaxID=3418488 RepID=UPI003DA754E4
MPKLHHDEVDIDPEIVVALLAEQFPDLVVDDLVEAEPAGTDNVNYRLAAAGEELVVRLPRKPDAAPGIAKEVRFGRLLGSALPVAIPAPTRVGRPSATYPFGWSVGPWLPGSLPVEGTASGELAADLARFVRALRAVDAAPHVGDAMLTSYRVEPIAPRFADTDAFLPRCEGWIDVPAVRETWESIKHVEPYEGPPAFAHTDLQPGNLLVDEHGRLSAVIDFGGLAVGDPTVDLLPAWQLLDADTRPRFRAELAVDEPTWRRGMAWAITIGVVALGYYAGSGSPLVARSVYQLEQVLLELA